MLIWLIITHRNTKGVAPQQNGNWGAEIYANNQRIWLGTFKSVADAANAYDRASIKLKSEDAPTNFPWTNTLTLQEANFQSQYSSETVLEMIKDESYETKFNDFRRERSLKDKDQNQRSPGLSCELIFQKELTSSDVGKFNRLVIPKKYAVRYFPPVPDEPTNDEIHLSFYDAQKRLWKFRYCYCKSSGCFVFTKGWNQFVKERKLMAKDNVTFYYHENLEMANMGFWVIDTERNVEATLRLGVGPDGNCSTGKENEDRCKDKKIAYETIQRSGENTKGVKLFGVRIIG